MECRRGEHIVHVKRLPEIATSCWWVGQTRVRSWIAVELHTCHAPDWSSAQGDGLYWDGDAPMMESRGGVAGGQLSGGPPLAGGTGGGWRGGGDSRLGAAVLKGGEQGGEGGRNGGIVVDGEVALWECCRGQRGRLRGGARLAAGNKPQVSSLRPLVRAIACGARCIHIEEINHLRDASGSTGTSAGEMTFCKPAGELRISCVVMPLLRSASEFRPAVSLLAATAGAFPRSFRYAAHFSSADTQGLRTSISTHPSAQCSCFSF